MYVRFMWQGGLFKFYKDKNGRARSYSTAIIDLGTINQQIEEKTFDPKEWLPAAIEEKKFENAMETWLARKEKEAQGGKLAPSTLGAYRTYKNLYYLTSKHLMETDIREIRLKHLQNFYDELPGSAKYRKNIMDALYTFFRWSKRWGEIKEVPTWPELEKVIEKERFALTYEDQQTGLARLPEAHRDIIEFLMETGLRPGEGCALQSGDIDFKRRRVLIRRGYSEGKLRDRTKQKKEQWIPLSDRACELIDANQNDTLFVFQNPSTHRGYRTEYLRRLWVKHSGTGVELYEGTRHSFCTQIIEEGATGPQAQQLMRHADRRSTDRYFHPTDDRARDIVNRRGKVINMERTKKK